ncbi:hypothetical protein ACN47E_006670 [Coniothyrium glycines]
MPDANIVAFNIAAFISTLFLLESGSDKFIAHTAIVARRTGTPETLIGLLTAGGEWEELAVVIASLARGRASLAIGNVVGSAVSNILGAFSLGLLFRDANAPSRFDRSSRIYSLVLLGLTSLVAPIIYLPTTVAWIVAGSFLIAFFLLYIGSVAWAIRKGTLAAPEDSDGDDGSDDESSDVDSETGVAAERTFQPANGRDYGAGEAQGNRQMCQAVPATSSTPLLPLGSSRRKHHSLKHHLFHLFLGFLAICLAGYVLSHAATNITDQFGVSDVFFGVVVLAIATTLPEKFVAVMSGQRGHAGILVANTAGSNIFLLTLCLGIVMLDTRGELGHGNVNVVELAVLWCSTVAFTATIWFGGRFCRLIGAVMLIAYIAFVVLEFTVIHSVVSGH